MVFPVVSKQALCFETGPVFRNTRSILLSQVDISSNEFLTAVPRL